MMMMIAFKVCAVLHLFQVNLSLSTSNRKYTDRRLCHVHVIVIKYSIMAKNPNWSFILIVFDEQMYQLLTWVGNLLR